MYRVDTPANVWVATLLETWENIVEDADLAKLHLPSSNKHLNQVKRMFWPPSLTFPQALQWCLLLVKVNLTSHFMQTGA